MKITDAWANRKIVIDACREANACTEQYKMLCKAESKQAFTEVLSRNFAWCVSHMVLEEWLPATFDCTTLDCRWCTGLTVLPEMPNCTTLYCSGCTGLTVLPEMPNCTTLYCSWCTGLTVLPEMPNCTTLYCSGCTGLTKKKKGR
jgi:hypothetical protein